MRPPRISVPTVEPDARTLNCRSIQLSALIALVAGLSGCSAFENDTSKTLTASFDRTVGLYVASDVRVLSGV